MVGGLRGQAAESQVTLAAGPGLFGALHDLLASLNPERDAVLARAGLTPRHAPALC